MEAWKPNVFLEGSLKKYSKPTCCNNRGQMDIFSLTEIAVG